MAVVRARAEASPDEVWACFTDPEHVVAWNFASEDWCCPRAETDVRSGGRFVWRMEARDGSMGFDLDGTFDRVERPNLLTWHLSDGRAVELTLTPDGTSTRIEQTFEPENLHPVDLQIQGWQAILDRFAAYATSLAR